MKSCTPLWREAHFEVKMHKTPQLRTAFGSCDVEKVHAVVARCGAKHISKSKCTKHTMVGPLLEVAMSKKCTPFLARSTFPSQNVQNTPWSDHFWKLRCRKSARRCGAKHISKSKCAKHTMVGPLLEVAMSKKCTPLWCEAHFQVKMYKTHHGRTTFGSCDVEKVYAVVVRSTFPSQNVQNTSASDHFWKLRCRKSARRCGAKHISKSKCTKHTMVGPVLEVAMSKKCTPLWREAHCQVKMYKAHHGRPLLEVAMSNITLHYTPQHYNYTYTTTLHYTPLHSTTHHYTTSHYTTLQLPDYIPLHSTAQNYTTLQFMTLHYTPLHYITLHYYTTLPSTTLHYITLHYTQLHYNYNYNCTPLHSTTLIYTTLNYTTLHYITLHYTTFHYTPLHYTTVHYTTLDWMTLHHR